MKMGVPRCLLAASGVAALLLGVGAGVAFGAYVTSGSHHWITFSNNGNSICVKREAVMSTLPSEASAGTYVRTYQENCSTPLNRQPGYHGAKAAIIRADGVICKAGGYSYSTAGASVHGDSTTNAVGPACRGNLRDRGRVKEWDVDTNTYKESNAFYSPFAAP